MSAVIAQMVLRRRAVRAEAAARSADYERMVAAAKGDPGMVWRGEWDKDTQYVPGDAVARKGSSYIATQASENEAPPGAKWDVLAKKGADGKSGKDGKDGATIIVAGGGSDTGSGTAGGGDATSVFITDIAAIGGIVGDKVYNPDTVPSNATVASCISDVATVRITVAASAGADKYSPDVTVNDIAVTLTESATKRWFTGTVDITLGAGDTIITAVNGSEQATAVITLAGAGPAVQTVAFDAYPGVQTALKSGDALAVTVNTDVDAVSVTLTGPATTLILPVVAGVASGTLTMSGATGTPTFSVVAKNAFGTAGAAFTSGTVSMDQVAPTFGSFTVTYPSSHTALDVGESATVNCVVSNATTVSYAGTGLSVTAPSTYGATKTVTHSLTGYTTTTYTITASRAANGASASASTTLQIATVAPTAAISITPTGRLTSSPAGTDYVVRITPNQALLSAPSLDASLGTWQGGGWASVSGYWTRTLRIDDGVARGAGTFSNMALTGPSAIAGTTITAGAAYTVGGFSSRTVTFAAFSRVAALGVNVATPAKMSAAIVGGNTLSLQGDNAVVENGFYPAASDGSYSATGAYVGLSDSAFAGSNTSGTLQVTVAEVA